MPATNVHGCCPLDYYEEMLSVAQCLICVEISGEMWRVYELIYKALIDDKALMGSSFFSGMAAGAYIAYRISM